MYNPYFSADAAATDIQRAAADAVADYMVENQQQQLDMARSFVDARIRLARRRVVDETSKMMFPRLIAAGIIGGVIGALVARRRGR